MSTMAVNVDSFVCKCLRSLSISSSESYDSILSRLLDCKIGVGVCEYGVCDVNNVCFVNLLVDWNCDVENLSFSLGDCYSNEFPVNKYIDYEVWNCFKERILCFDDIFNVLAILDKGEYCFFDDLIFYRKC